MPTIDVTADEYENEFPPVCAKCGEAATDQNSETVRYVDGSAVGLKYFLSFLGLVFFPPLLVVMFLCCDRRLLVRLPVCYVHRRTFPWRDHVIVWLIVPVWTAALIAIHVSVIAYCGYVVAWLAYVAALILVPILVMWVIRRVLFRGEVMLEWVDATREVRIAGAHADFIAAIEQRRPPPEPRRPRRRRRRVEYDSMDNDDDYDDWNEPPARRRAWDRLDDDQGDDSDYDDDRPRRGWRE